jgi:ketosteroid isomerase-like protein
MSTSVEALVARIDALESRNAIERLVVDYAHAFDGKNEALLASIWHDDASFDLGEPFGSFVGPQAIVEGARGLWAQIDPQHHWMANYQIDVEGDQARGVIALDCFATSVDAGPSMIAGTYHDRYERRDGQWKIADRRFVMAYFAPLQGWTAAMGTEADVPAAG